MTPRAMTSTTTQRAGRALVRLVVAAAMLLALSGRPARGQFYDLMPYQSAPIDYDSAARSDPATLLAQRVASGEVTLKRDAAHGYLRSLLHELNVPVSSQMLVFSKTSFQLRRISPQTPRAVYFNDDVYVGWVPGSDVLEISAAEPRQGGVFYTLGVDASGRPTFQRNGQCLTCHASSRTLGVPGHLVRSIYPDADGQPVSGSASYVSDHRSPLEQRWGGWYVTGHHGQHRHMGNAIVTDKTQPERMDTEAGANVTDLSDRFNTSLYLSPHSDIVALMVLEHQTRMQNLITRANYEARLALYRQSARSPVGDGQGAQAAASPAADPVADLGPAVRQRVARVTDELLRYMLFIDETALDGPIVGTSSFADDFQKRGPFDRQGRSLRQLDLRRWLFKVPCSYMIYSKAFDELPPPMLRYVYRRLYDLLASRDRDPRFSLLSTADRRAILEILRDTKPNLPDYWHADEPSR